MFTKNKNIETILSSKGLENLSTIEFYKYALFYIGLSITISWLYLIYFGY